jgi:hypothetical protein
MSGDMTASSNSLMTIYVISKSEKVAYCAAARLRAVGYEAGGMGETKWFYYSVVYSKGRDLYDVLSDLHDVIMCMNWLIFIIVTEEDEYIYVRPEDLEEYFGYFYEYFVDCEEGYKDFSDYRHCVGLDDTGYDGTLYFGGEISGIKWNKHKL